jgi:hypothetical protein
MPKQVLPNAEDFAWFESAMKRSGFIPITREKFLEDWHRLNLKAPRPQPGQEAGFIFIPPNGKNAGGEQSNDLYVCIWTSWLRREEEARKSDPAWVLIARRNSDEKPFYFSHPTLRTKNFFRTLAQRAWITAWRVQHRPHCPACNALMEIAKKRGELKQRYWRCNLLDRHADGKPHWYRWDIGLPPRAQTLVSTWRAKRIPHVERCIAAGKNPHQAMLDRKPWKSKIATP